MSDNVNKLLEERGMSHGDVKVQAEIAQKMQENLRLSPNWKILPYHIRQSLDMIALKMSRLVTGNPTHEDSWTDIEGYARLGKRP